MAFLPIPALPATSRQQRATWSQPVCKQPSDQSHSLDITVAAGIGAVTAAAVIASVALPAGAQVFASRTADANAPIMGWQARDASTESDRFLSAAKSGKPRAPYLAEVKGF